MKSGTAEPGVTTPPVAETLVLNICEAAVDSANPTARSGDSRTLEETSSSYPNGRPNCPAFRERPFVGNFERMAYASFTLMADAEGASIWRPYSVLAEMGPLAFSRARRTRKPFQGP